MNVELTYTGMGRHEYKLFDISLNGEKIGQMSVTIGELNLTSGTFFMRDWTFHLDQDCGVSLMIGGRSYNNKELNNMSAAIITANLIVEQIKIKLKEYDLTPEADPV